MTRKHPKPSPDRTSTSGSTRAEASSSSDSKYPESTLNPSARAQTRPPKGVRKIGGAVGDNGHSGVDGSRADGKPRAGGAWIIAAIGMALQTLGMLGMAAWVLIELVRGDASNASRSVTEGVCLVLLSVGTGLLTLNLARAKSLAKTPTLLWNGMMVAVGLNLVQGGAAAVGYALIAVAIAVFVAALTLPRYDVAGDDQA